MATTQTAKKKPAPKVRKTCKHPGRFFNRCSNCPLRKR